VDITLHLTDDTDLVSHGFVAGSSPFAAVEWDRRGRLPDAPCHGVLWGTPGMLRQLAAVAVQAAKQAEEEAARQAHPTATAAAEEGRVA
jgi:hypothetical protein